MCGRFACAAVMATLRAHYDAAGPEVDWQPSWNICPTRDIPVMLGGTGGRRIGLMHWGWRPEVLKGRLLINCRSEEAASKPLFQPALARRRCLVPATAFYEWQPAQDSRRRGKPHAFARPSGEPFCIAGLWAQKGVVLLTSAADTVVAPVHHRMPVILADDHLDAWLDASSPPDAITTCLQNRQTDRLRCWPVSTDLNDPRRDGPELLDDQPKG